MSAEGISLGALFLELGLDTESFFQDLEFVRSQALNTAKDIKFKIDFDASAAHETLKGLNDHLDLKEDHIKRLNQMVISPSVDFSDLDLLDSRLEALTDRDIDIRLNIDSSDIDNVRAKLENLYASGEVTVNVVARSEERENTYQNLDSKLDKLEDAINNLAEKVKDSDTNDIVSGLFQGIGGVIGNKIGEQVDKGLKRNFNFDIEKVAAKGFDTLAVPVKAVIDNPRLQEEINHVGTILENRFRKAFYKIGDGIVAALENREGDLESRLNSFIKEAFSSGGFTQEFENLVEDLKKKTPDLVNSLIPTESLEKAFEKIGGLVANYRNKALDERALPLVKERAEEILSQKRAKNSAKVVDEETNELFIASGGYAGARGLSGAMVAQDLNKELPKDKKAIWVKNEDSDLPKESMSQAFSKFEALMTSLGKPNLRGYSKDAVEMAAQAVAAVERNPNITVKLIGESGGGFVAEEAFTILKKMGIQNVQYLGVGTPNFTGRLQDKGKLISPDEFLGAEVHGLYGKLGLAQTKNASENILGVKDHPLNFYREAGIAELENFIKGSPEKIQPEQLSEIKKAADQFKAQDTDSLDSRQKEHIAKLAFQNLQNVRRHITSGIYDLNEEDQVVQSKYSVDNNGRYRYAGGSNKGKFVNKEELETDKPVLEIIKQKSQILDDLNQISEIFQQVYIRTAGEPGEMQTVRSVLSRAQSMYADLSNKPGLQSGKVANQIKIELIQIQEEFKQKFGNSIGTIGEKFKDLNKQLSKSIEAFSDPSLGVRKESDVEINAKNLVQKAKLVSNEIDKVLTDYAEIPQFEQILETLHSVINEVETESKNLNESANKKFGEAAKKYRNLAETLKSEAENLKAGSEGLQISKVDEVINKPDYFKAESLPSESYSLYHKAALSQIKGGSKVDIPDPWENKNQLIEVGKKALTTATEVTKDVTNLFKQIGAVVGAKGASDLVSRINSQLKRSGEANTIIANPRQIEKLSDLKLQDIQHLVELGFKDINTITQFISQSKPVSVAKQLTGKTDQALSGRINRMLPGVYDNQDVIRINPKPINNLRDLTPQDIKQFTISGVKDTLFALGSATRKGADLTLGAAQTVTNLLPDGDAKNRIQGALDKANNILEGISNKMDQLVGYRETLALPPAEKSNVSIEDIHELVGLPPGGEAKALPPAAGQLTVQSNEGLTSQVDKVAENVIREVTKNVDGTLKSIDEIADEIKKIREGFSKAYQRIKQFVASFENDAPLEGVGKITLSMIETQLEIIQKVKVEALQYVKQMGEELRAQGRITEKTSKDKSIGSMISGAQGNVKKSSDYAESETIRARKIQSDRGVIDVDFEEVKGSGIGQNFAQAQGQGIAQGSESAKKAAQEAAQEIIDITEDTFEIKSPSRRGIRIGEMFIEGLRIGLNKLNQLTIGRDVESQLNNTEQATQKAAISVKNLSSEKSAIFSFFEALYNGGKFAVETFNNLEKALNKPIFGIENLGTNLKNLVGGFLAFQVASQAWQWLSQFSQAAFKASIELDRLKTAMTFAAGSSTQATKDLSFVRQTVDSLGIPLGASQKGFVQMSAAAKSAGLTSQDVRDTFLGISQASTTLGLSVEDTQGIFLALEQVMSKGKLQAEEIRGQIGERLPGAFALAAKSMGTSEQEFNKMLETGQIISNDFIPKFAKQLQTEFGGSAESASQNAQSAMFRFQNAVIKAQEAFGNLVTPQVAGGFQSAAQLIELVVNNIDKLINALIGVGVGAAIKFANQLNLVGVAGNLIKGAFTGLQKAVGEGLGFVEAVINKDEKAIGTLKVSLQVAWTTIKNIAKTLATEFILPTMLIKTAEGLMDIFGRDELTTKMHDFTEQAVNGLERIRQKASEARGEVSKIGEKGSNKSGGIDLTLGLGDMMGFSFKTDDIIKGIRGFNDSTNNLLPESQRVKAIDKDAEGRYTGFVTSAEKKFNDSMDEAIAQRESAFSLYDQVGSGKLKTNKQVLLKQAKEKGASPEEIKHIQGFKDDIDISASVGQIKLQDEQLRILQARKSALQGQPTIDKKQIKQVDEEIKRVTEDRAKTAEPLLAARQFAENQLKSIDSQIEEAKRKFGEFSPEVDELNKKFRVTKNVFETALRQLDGFEKPLKDAIDPARALAIAFEKLGTEIERINKKAENDKLAGLIRNAQEFSSGWSTNRFNTSEKGVKDAITERTVIETQRNSTKEALNQLAESVNAPQNQSVLKGITDSAGNQITLNSSDAQIKEAKQKLGSGTGNQKQKDILENIEKYKKYIEEYKKLGLSYEEANNKVKEAIQNDALNKIGEKAADREAINQRIEALNQLKNAQREASIVMQKANADQPKGQIAIKKASLGLSTEEAGVKEADIGIKQSQIGIQEAKNQITAAREAEALARRRLNDNKAQQADLEAAFKKGDVGMEEYHKRSRDLTTQNVQAQSALGQATANVTKAQAGLKQAGVAAQEAIANKIAATITLQKAQFETDLNLKKAKNQITPEDASVKLAQYQFDLAKKGGSRLEIQRAEIALIEATNAKLKDQLEKYLRIEEINIQIKQTLATNQANTALLNPNAGEFTQSQVGRNTRKIDQQATSERIALKQYELSSVQKLINQGVISEKEGVDRINGIRQNLAQMEGEQLQRRIQTQKELTESSRKLEDAQIEAQGKQINYLKEINSINQERLNITKNLLTAQYDLSKSQSDVRQGVLQNTISILDKAFTIATELKEQNMSEPEKQAWEATKKQTSTEAKQKVLQNINQYTGVDTSNPTGIFTAKSKIEDQLAGEKASQLKADQEFQRQQLELDIQSNRMQAEALKLDAESLKIQARTLQLQLERQKLDLKIAEKEAIKSGDADSLAIIKNIKGVIGLSENDVARTLELAANKSALADQKIASVEAIGDMQRQTLYNKQVAESNQFNANEFMRKQDQTLAAGNAGISPNQINPNYNYVGIPEPPRTGVQLGFATGVDSQGREIGADGKPVGVNKPVQVDLGSAINKLAEAINGLSGNLSRPNLTVVGKEPKESAGKIYNDINNIRADAARI